MSNNNKIKTTLPYSGNGKKPRQVDKTNISIDVSLWNKLRKIGTKGETYTMIIQKLLDFYVKENGVKGI